MWAKKFFAWSFDDGLEQDKRICEAVAAHDDVVACSIVEALRLHKGR